MKQHLVERMAEQVCTKLRGEPCMKCPEWEEHPAFGTVSRGCYRESRELAQAALDASGLGELVDAALAYNDAIHGFEPELVLWTAKSAVEQAALSFSRSLKEVKG